ncbi:MAG: SdrD B-like domain-containing protein [Acidimicrobiia bacterium]|nr:SdrD B-like domain-containing protein [Acidimicrobiia bacterium]
MSLGKISSLTSDLNGNGALDPGESITYTVTIRNDGTADINPSVFTDDLDPNTTYVSGTTTVDGLAYPDAGSTPFPFDEGGQDLGIIVPGQVIVIAYDVRLDDPLPDGVDSVVNSAQLNSVGISITGTSTLPVFDPSLQITKTSDVPPEGAIPGDVITYTLLVENISDTFQDGFSVVDVVPQGTTYVPNSTSVTGPVATVDTYADDMESGGYGGSTGSRFWGPDWTEVNEFDGVNAGDERSVSSGGSIRLRVQDNDGGGEGLSRAVDLDGYDRATLTFDFARSGFDVDTDWVKLEANNGVGGWQELAIWTGPGSDPVFLSSTHSLDGYLTADAAIRFITSPTLGRSDRFLFDNVVITASALTDETLTNTSGGGLADGAAPNLVVPADPFALDPGETMTVTFQVVVDDPLVPDITELTNTARVASSQQPIFTDDSVTDPVALPELQLTKSLLGNADEDSSGDVTVGDTLTFQFVAENVGDTDLQNVSITDPMAGLSALSCLPPMPASLAMGESLICTATYPVTQADVNASRIDNTATATGEDPAGRPVTDDSTETVPINPVPAITLAKSLLTDLSGAAAGTVFDYEFVITNTGNVDLSDVVLSDPMLGGILSCPQSTLAPSEAMTCNASYTVTQNDVDTGQVANTATVAANDPLSNPLLDSDDELAILEQNASIALDKAMAANADEDGSGGVSVGDTLTYEFVATNDGNVTLSNVVITDPMAGLSALSCAPVAGGSLAPAAQMTCTATYSVTQADVDAGSIDNTATVTGTAASGSDVSDTADESVAAAQNPSITLTKSFAANADEDSSGDVTLNDTLTYAFDVVNDGDVTLTVVTITDPLPGLSAFACGPDILPVTLAPSATVSCTATYSVTQPDVDAGRIDNTATATGFQPNGLPISDDDDETVLPDRNPSIDLAKSLTGNADEDASGDVSLGDTLTYTFVATNDGDVGLDNVTITDPLAGMSALSCAPVAGSSLAPTEAMTCTATYVVTQANVDAGEVVNTATAIGDDSGGGGSVTDSDGVTTSTAQNPSIDLSKSLAGNADEDASGDVSVGDTLTYDFVVTNAGDVTLASIVLDDPLTGGTVTCPQATLAPAAAMTCSASYSVTQPDVDAGSIANTATVTADDPSGNPVTDSDSELVSPHQNPSIVLVKSLFSNADEDGSGNVSAGDTLTYRFVASNDGDVTLDLVAVTDPLPGMSALSCMPASGSSLTVGGTMACIATYTVTQVDVDSGSVDNTATVVAERPGGDPGNTGDDVSDSDDHSVLIPPEPEIQLTKSMSGNADEDGSGTVTVGDTLSYDFLVANTGNVTLSSVGVTDPLVGVVTCPITILAPGESTTCTGSHVVDLADADAGFVINTAEAAGTDPHGTVVTDDDAVAEPVVTGPAISLTKNMTANADEDGSGGVSIADTLTYEFVATNTGDVTLSAVRIVDPMSGLSALTCTPAAPAVLLPGETISCSATYSVTQTDIDLGQIVNTATAEGFSPDSTLVSDTDDEQVLVAQTPSITLEKTLVGNDDEDGSGGVTRDDTLTYQFEATNTGNVTLSNTVISDPMPGLGALTCVPAQPAVLTPGATLTCSAEYVVTQTDVDTGQIDNTATVDAVDPDSTPVSDTDSLTTPIEGSPTITLVKHLDANADEDGSGDVSVGDTLTYSFDVANTGDVSLTNVTVSDPLPGLGAITCAPAQGSTLAPGGTMACTAPYTVTAADATTGQVTNTATVVGLAPAGTPTSDTDTETVLTARADLSLFKSASDINPNVGDTITYVLTLVNDGPDTATNVAVADVLPAGLAYETGSIAGGSTQDASAVPTLIWTVASIPASTSINLTYAATVQAPSGAPDEYLNVAQVTASAALDPDSTPDNDDGDQSEDDETNETVTPQAADLSLAKTVSDATPDVGQTVTFTITISNAGPNDATGVAVADSVPDGYTNIVNVSSGGSAVGSTVTWSGLTVPAGGTTAVTFDAEVLAPTADYDNTAEVTASDQRDPDSAPDNDDGDQSEDDEDGAGVTPLQADLSLVKTVSDASPNVGDTVTFTITVSNGGPDDATGVDIEDVVPAGYSAITNISDGGSEAGGVISWTGLAVAAGGSTAVTFDVTVAAPTGAPGEYVNVAEVVDSDRYDPDSTPDNDDGDQSEDDEDATAVVPQEADLSLVKSVSDSAPLVGEVVTFTLSVSNAGPDDATGVSLADTVPNGYASIGSISDGGLAVGNVVTWSGLSVPAGGSTSVTFQAEVQAPPAAYLNMAEVTASDQFDPDSTPNNDDGDQSEDDEDNVGLLPTEADLELSKTVSDATPGVGDTVTFTITVVNLGSDDASGIAVVDDVPSGYTNVANVSGGGIAAGSTVTWSGLAISSGGSIILTFEADVVAPTGAPSEYVNVAEVTASDQFDPDSTPNNDDGDQSEDDEDSASVVPEVADLELTKSVSNATPNVGDTVTFTITVANFGPDDVAGVAVEDVVPSGFSGIGSISNGGGVVGNTVTWSGLSITALDTVILTFDAVVDPPTGAADEYKNVAEVTGSDRFDPDSTPDNDDGDQSEDDEDAVSAVPQLIDLSLTKTVSDPSPSVGDVVTFTVTVANAGPDTATGVAVEDSVPDGFSAIGSISNGGSAVGSAVTWSGLTIASGGSVVLTFEATVEAPPADYTNVAEVTAADQYDPDSTPNNDDGDQSEDDEDAVSAIPQLIDLSLTKTVSSPSPNVGDVVTFTVTVSNAGPDSATGVSVEDSVPDGFSSIAAISNGGSAVGSTVAWSGLVIAAGGSVDLTFAATVEAPPAGYSNVAEVTAADQYDPDSTPGNDDGDQSEDDEDAASLMPQQVDLSLAKTVSDPSPNVGDVVTFTVTVSNAGPDAATTVAVEDAVPSGFSSIGSISNGGSAVGNTVTWSGLTVVSGGSVDLTFEATVEAPPADFTNVAEVTAADQYDPDSTPDNDDGDQSEDDEDSAILVPQQIDLSLAKSVSNASPNVGDVVTFTVTVSNVGPDIATGVAVEDAVPDGFSGIAAISNGGSAVGSTVTWSGLTIAAGGSMDLTFAATVEAPPADFTNVVEVIAADQYDTDSTPNNDDGDQSEDDEDAASLVPQQIDLSLTKTVSDPSPNVGDVVTFTVTVANAGPDSATGVAVEDVVPSGFSGIGAISNGGSAVGSVVTWSGLTIAAGGSMDLTFAATVEAPPADYANVAQVTAADQYDQDSTPGNDDGDQSEDDEDSASAVPQRVDLSLAKAISDASPNVGDTVTFTVTVSNAGPDIATGVAVEDAVPDGFSAIGSISNGGSAAGNTVTWSGLTIASGGSIDLTFQATVEAPPADYTNVAEVTAADQYDPDSTPSNDDGDQSEDDEDSAGAVPRQIDLSLTKAVSDPSPNVGDVVTFTVTVANAGPAAATDVAVEDAVPSGFSAIGSISNGGSEAGNTVTWSGLTIGPGGSLDLTFEATVEAPPAGYTNVAEVTAADQYDPDSTPNNDDGDQSEDDEDAAVASPLEADLDLAKTVSNAAPNVGDVVTFTITVTNFGPSDATGVSVDDVVPSGFSNIGSISGGGSAVGSTVTWSGLTIASGGSATLTFQATVEPPTGTPGEYVNTAEVTSADQFDPDSTPGNDDGDQSEDDEDAASLVPQQIDLSLTKTVSDATPNVGDVVTFTITATNAGPDNATGVAVADVVPAGYSSIGAASGGGVVVVNTVTWLGLSIPAGDSVVLTFAATVEAPPADYANFAEVIAADQYDTDSTPNNDDGDQSEDDEDSASVVPQQIDLSLAKTVSDPSPNVGDVVTFTVTVANAGPDTATGVAVEDVVPSGFSSIGSISNGGSAVGSTVIWSGLTIGAGGSVDLTFEATVEAPPADFTNVAEVTAADQYDPDSTPGNDDGDQSEDDEDAAGLVPQQIDLEVSKSVDDATPPLGATVVYTINVTNRGPNDATGVDITDALPSGVGGISSISNAGVLAGGTITWADLSIGAGATIALTFEAVVGPVSGIPGEHENTVQVSAADQFDPDSTPGNDDGDQSEDDESAASISPAIIGLAKAVSSVVSLGDGTYTVTYLLTVENLGSVTLVDILLTDDVLGQFSGLDPSSPIAIDGSLTANPSWDGSASANVLAAGQSLDPGETGTVSISVVLTPGADMGPHDNTADVSGETPSGSTVTDQSTDGIDPDSDGDDSDGTVDDDDDPGEDDPTPVSFSEAPLLGLAKSGPVDPMSNGDGSFDVSYTLTVANLGDVVLSGVQVVDDLAATYADAVAWSLVGVSSIELDVSPTFDGMTDTALLTGADTMDPGATATVVIDLIVEPGADLGTYWNTATGTATSPAGTTVGDVSQNGTDIDPDANGDPTDNNDPTPTSFPALGSVSGTVWNDADADTAIGAGENGIGGIPVQLIDPGPDGVIGGGDDSVVAAVVTSPDGSFVFVDVPAGDYVVVVDSAGFPDPMLQTFDPDLTLDHNTPVSVVSGADSADNDFGYVGMFNLVLTKTVAGDQQRGGLVAFTITVRNEGPARALGPITVTDTVPDELPVAALDNEGWDCVAAGQDVTCVLAGDLDPGASATITVSATVAVDFGSEATNTAVVEVTGPVPEVDISDNADSASVAVDELPRTGADLGRIALLGLLLLAIGSTLVRATARRS